MITVLNTYSICIDKSGDTNCETILIIVSVQLWKFRYKCLIKAKKNLLFEFVLYYQVERISTQIIDKG